MVCEWGMSEKMAWSNTASTKIMFSSDATYPGRATTAKRPPSKSIRKCENSSDDSYRLAKNAHCKSRQLEVIAKALLEYETLDGSQIKEIVEHGRLINPPPGASPPPAKKCRPKNRPSKS